MSHARTAAGHGKWVLDRVKAEAGRECWQCVCCTPARVPSLAGKLADPVRRPRLQTQLRKPCPKVRDDTRSPRAAPFRLFPGLTHHTRDNSRGSTLRSISLRVGNVFRSYMAWRFSQNSGVESK